MGTEKRFNCVTGQVTDEPHTVTPDYNLPYPPVWGQGAEYADLGLRPVSIWQAAGAATAITVFGDAALTATGTATASAALAATNQYTATRLLEYLVTTPATNAIAGFRGAANKWFMSSGETLGGFRFVCRFGLATGVSVSTTRCFVGMTAATGAPTDVEPSSLSSTLGVGWDAADSNIQMMHNDGGGSATKHDLGANFPVPTADRTKVYELRMDVAPNSTTVNYTFADLANPVQSIMGRFSANLPAVGTMLSPRGWLSVGGTSSVIGIGLASLVVQG
jgi:hypothetical protein